MTGKIDMHIHTTCSDGRFDPLEIAVKCKEAELSAFSITDHDTFSAYSDELLDEANRLQLQCITGMELSTLFCGESVHLLAYNFSLDSPVLKDLCATQKEKRKERNQKILSKLRKMNPSFRIEMEDIYIEGRDTVGRVHIADVMLDRGYITTFQEAFEYIGDGKSCHAIVDYIELKNAVNLLKGIGAFVSLAHPHIINHELCKQIWDAKIDFDAIECFWKTAKRWQCNRFTRIAGERGFKVTGGSDFHGLKENEKIGSSYITSIPWL